MNQPDRQARKWTKPRLERLGAIRDVAGSKVINNDGPHSIVHS